MLKILGAKLYLFYWPKGNLGIKEWTRWKNAISARTLAFFCVSDIFFHVLVWADLVVYLWHFPKSDWLMWWWRVKYKGTQTERALTLDNISVHILHTDLYIS